MSGAVMRIGQGYDAHRFGGKDPLVIGGVSIDYEMGLVAHSDGDVLVHALCDALLGAAALGDIGRHFPDSDSAYENIDSRVLLRQVVAHIEQSALRVGNVDITLVAQAPRMAPHLQRMRENLAADLKVGTGQVNVKATTTEGMGFAGRKEGIACYAVALLEPLA
ncbi:MAG: 2-C-methyl-D-erythritol 2,4-cyclodiphosphate synthase [Sedimenticola sp.]